MTKSNQPKYIGIISRNNYSNRPYDFTITKELKPISTARTQVIARADITCPDDLSSLFKVTNSLLNLITGLNDLIIKPTKRQFQIRLTETLGFSNLEYFNIYEPVNMEVADNGR